MNVLRASLITNDFEYRYAVIPNTCSVFAYRKEFSCSFKRCYTTSIRYFMTCYAYKFIYILADRSYQLTVNKGAFPVNVRLYFLSANY